MQTGTETYFSTRRRTPVSWPHAERYYRIMYYGSHESWNLRDRHMFDTLQRVLAWAGPDKKAVVWAHNSHIGDARFTDMGIGARRVEHRPVMPRGLWTRRGPDRLRHACRHGRRRLRMGCADGDQGRSAVASGQLRGAVPSGRATSGSCWTCDAGLDAGSPARLGRTRLERYIGVIYRPETERWSHYSLRVASRPVRRVRMVRRDPLR